jgi:hypothetical protein
MVRSCRVSRGLVGSAAAVLVWPAEPAIGQAGFGSMGPVSPVRVRYGMLRQAEAAVPR